MLLVSEPGESVGALTPLRFRRVGDETALRLEAFVSLALVFLPFVFFVPPAFDFAAFLDFVAFDCDFFGVFLSIEVVVDLDALFGAALDFAADFGHLAASLDAPASLRSESKPKRGVSPSVCVLAGFAAPSPLPAASPSAGDPMTSA